jgi:hypothetical protein
VRCIGTTHNFYVVDVVDVMVAVLAAAAVAVDIAKQQETTV